MDMNVEEWKIDSNILLNIVPYIFGLVKTMRTSLKYPESNHDLSDPRVPSSLLMQRCELSQELLLK